jgi:CheY-like chemotaxis protein
MRSLLERQMNSRLKIAVADDESDTREYLQEYLTYLGHEVRAAADGRALVELCGMFAPDLVITDYAMPGLDGLSAAAEINQARPVPVILISGRHEVEDAADAIACVVKFFTKPVKNEELQAAVEAISRGDLRHSRLESAGKAI